MATKAKLGRSGRSTGATAAFVKAIAGALPGARASATGRGTTFTAGRTAFLVVEGDAAVDLDGNDIGLTRKGRDDVRSAVERSWARVAPSDRVAEHRRARAAWRRRRPITYDDIRRIAVGFPGATVGEAWGHLGFLFSPKKRSHFAWYGAGTITSLAPPDDEDALIVHCPYRAELLASRPDRYFVTPHYGDPDRPGFVVTRLTEHRGQDDLARLAELLEDGWHDMAG